MIRTGPRIDNNAVNYKLNRGEPWDDKSDVSSLEVPLVPQLEDLDPGGELCLVRGTRMITHVPLQRLREAPEGYTIAKVPPPLVRDLPKENTAPAGPIPVGTRRDPPYAILDGVDVSLAWWGLFLQPLPRKASLVVRLPPYSKAAENLAHMPDLRRLPRGAPRCQVDVRVVGLGGRLLPARLEL